MTAVEEGWNERSSQIPRDIFSSSEIFKLEQERIGKGPIWHLLAHESELPNEGDYKRMSIADVPIFVVRGVDGTVGGYLNACSHRGTEIVALKRGNAGKRIRCIYHGWSYELNGELSGVPLPTGFPDGFDKKNHGLRKVRVESFHGLIFATLSDRAQPLQDYLGEKMRECIVDALGSDELVYLGSQSVELGCNWKLIAENGFDNYHAQVLHGIVRMLRTRTAPGSEAGVAYSTDGNCAHAWTAYRSLPIEEKDRDTLNDYALFDVEGRVAAGNYVLVLFSGAFVHCQLDLIQARYVTPLSADKTKLEFANFARKSDSASMIDHRVHQANLFGPAGVVSVEDATALERIQASSTAPGVNIVVKGARPDRPPYQYAEEAAIAEYYGAYRRMMSIGD